MRRGLRILFNEIGHTLRAVGCVGLLRALLAVFLRANVALKLGMVWDMALRRLEGFNSLEQEIFLAAQLYLLAARIENHAKTRIQGVKFSNQVTRLIKKKSKKFLF